MARGVTVKREAERRALLPPALMAVLSPRNRFEHLTRESVRRTSARAVRVDLHHAVACGRASSVPALASRRCTWRLCDWPPPAQSSSGETGASAPERAAAEPSHPAGTAAGGQRLAGQPGTGVHAAPAVHMQKPGSARPFPFPFPRLALPKPQPEPKPVPFPSKPFPHPFPCPHRRIAICR